MEYLNKFQIRKLPFRKKIIVDFYLLIWDDWVKKPIDTFTADHDCNRNNNNGAFLNSAHTMCALNILPLVTGPVHSFTISTPFLEYTALAAISALVTNRTHNVPILEGEKHDISLKIVHQAGFETGRQ